jgi:hypothetical protein
MRGQDNSFEVRSEIEIEIETFLMNQTSAKHIFSNSPEIFFFSKPFRNLHLFQPAFFKLSSTANVLLTHNTWVVKNIGAQGRKYGGGGSSNFCQTPGRVNVFWAKSQRVHYFEFYCSFINKFFKTFSGRVLCHPPYPLHPHSGCIYS